MGRLNPVRPEKILYVAQTGHLALGCVPCRLGYQRHTRRAAATARDPPRPPPQRRRASRRGGAGGGAAIADAARARVRTPSSSFEYIPFVSPPLLSPLLVI